MLNIPHILEAIDQFTLKQTEEKYTVLIPARGGPRKYLGLSALGEECLRRTWYAFRHASEKQAPARMIRLWNRGHKEEYSFNHLLRGIGFQVFDVDENGNQFKVDDFEGHVSGHFDGVALAGEEFWIEGSTPHPFLCEYKTYKNDRFNTLVKEGVKKQDVKYYIQMQTYMGYQKLKGALFMAVNKDNDTFYFEWVPFHKPTFNRAIQTAEYILTAQEPPERMRFASASFWMCKNKTTQCESYEVCFKNAAAIVSCRSCKHASPGPDKSWLCAKGREYGEVCKDYSDITK